MLLRKKQYFIRLMFVSSLMSFFASFSVADEGFYVVSQDGRTFTLGFQGSTNSSSKWLTIYQVEPELQTIPVPTFTNTMIFENLPAGTYTYELDTCIYDYWVGVFCSSEAVPYGVPLPTVTVVVNADQPPPPPGCIYINGRLVCPYK